MVMPALHKSIQVIKGHLGYQYSIDDDIKSVRFCCGFMEQGLNIFLPKSRTCARSKSGENCRPSLQERCTSIDIMIVHRKKSIQHKKKKSIQPAIIDILRGTASYAESAHIVPHDKIYQWLKSLIQLIHLISM